MRRLVLAALSFAVVAMAGPTLVRAADMATPGPSYYPHAPMPPALYDWTGIYLGGNVGVGFLSDNATQLGGAPAVPILNSANIAPVNAVGGGQVGINYEFAPWVVGAEASWTASALSGGATVLTPIVATPNEQISSNPQWFAALTGRVGYAANTVLFYVKGGGAWTHVVYTESTLAGGTPFFTQNISDNRSGFTAGGGIEYGMTENLSAKLEYDYYDFGTKNYAFISTPISMTSKVNVITVGLNWRLNWVGGWH
jgi:outer membrane immunogenic protein